MGVLEWIYALLYYLGWWRKAATVVFLGPSCRSARVATAGRSES
jgi:hypothetical protein